MIDVTTLTIVDYAVVVVLFISAVFSTLRGMTREFLGLLGWVVSVIVANYAKPLLEDPIADLINSDGLSAALAWGLPSDCRAKKRSTVRRKSLLSCLPN